ncbi:hypothetical protein Cgig2_022196 [Carnegiea gigantea]|uniref:Uncharacterized protein n=1 Tax=Carnegiea gigantea TaxID=171969 RepID=A0A9Q1GYF8_9CARY|nr:hypothetical protein Cgig2_022196 [Carnegiea gigantea]
MEGVAAISKAQDFNTVVIKEPVGELHCAYTEFTKVQLKQQPNKDDSEPSFRPTLALGQPESKAPMPTTTSMVDASISVDREEHCPKYGRSLSLKRVVEQKRESARVEVEHKPIDCNKPNVLPKMKLRPKAQKEVQAEKDDEKVVATIITPAKVGEVGPSIGMKNGQPEKLPIAYCSPYVI